jgi:hypothetical protein
MDNAAELTRQDLVLRLLEWKLRRTYELIAEKQLELARLSSLVQAERELAERTGAKIYHLWLETC